MVPEPAAWFNALTIAGVFLQEFTDFKIINFYVADPHQSEAMTSWVMGLIALINIALRLFKTKEPLFLN